MTTEPLPARHCIARVIELNGWPSAVLEEVEQCPRAYPQTILHARTLEEYGYQPPPPPLDPVRKRAREICAEFYRVRGEPGIAKHYADGKLDDGSMMQVAEKALREPGL